MIDELKEIFGEKGFWIVIIVAVVLFVLMLTMGGKSEEETAETIMVTPTAYSSYPDAVTNANTIIDSVNKYTEYTADRLEESTAGYIENGLAKLTENLDSNFNMIDESINDLGVSVEEMHTDMNTGFSDMKSAIGKINTRTNTVYVPQTVYYETPSTVVTSKPKVDIEKAELPPAETPKTQYYSGTNYSGNSIVDGLKSIGVYSIDGQRVDNWQSRKDLAAANGITNYTGTAAQNTALLNKLKSGTLVKS